MSNNKMTTTEEQLKQIEAFTKPSSENLESFVNETKNEEFNARDDYTTDNTDEEVTTEYGDDDTASLMATPLLSTSPATPLTPNTPLSPYTADDPQLGDEVFDDVPRKRRRAPTTTKKPQEDRDQKAQPTARRSRRKRQKRKRADFDVDPDDEEYEEYFQEDEEDGEDDVEYTEEADEAYQEDAEKKARAKKGVAVKREKPPVTPTTTTNTAANARKKRRVAAKKTAVLTEDYSRKIKISFKECRDDEYDSEIPSLLYTHSLCHKYDLKIDNVNESCLSAIDNSTLLNSLALDLVFAQQLTVPQLLSDVTTNPVNQSWKSTEPIGHQSIRSIHLLSCSRKRRGTVLIRFAINSLYDSKKFNNAKFRLRVVFQPGNLSGGFTKYTSSFSVISYKNSMSRRLNTADANDLRKYTGISESQVSRDALDANSSLHKNNSIGLLVSALHSV